MPFVAVTCTPSNLKVSGAFTPVDNFLLSCSLKTPSALARSFIVRLPISTSPPFALTSIFPDFSVASFIEIDPLFEYTEMYPASVTSRFPSASTPIFPFNLTISFAVIFSFTFKEPFSAFK